MGFVVHLFLYLFRNLWKFIQVSETYSVICPYVLFRTRVHLAPDTPFLVCVVVMCTWTKVLYLYISSFGFPYCCFFFLNVFWIPVVLFFIFMLVLWSCKATVRGKKSFRWGLVVKKNVFVSLSYRVLLSKILPTWEGHD